MKKQTLQAFFRHMTAWLLAFAVMSCAMVWPGRAENRSTAEPEDSEILDPRTRTLDEEMNEFARELRETMQQYAYKYYDPENVTFMKTMETVYKGDPEHPDGLIRNVAARLIRMATDMTTGTGTLIDPEHDKNEIMMDIELLQTVIHSSRQGLDQFCEDSLARPITKLDEALAGGKMLVNFVKGALKSKTALLKKEGTIGLDELEAAQRIAQMVNTALPDFMSVTELTDITTGLIGIINCLATPARNFQEIHSAISFLEGISAHTTDQNLKSAAEAMIEVYSDWYAELAATEGIGGAGIEEVTDPEKMRAYSDREVNNRLAAYVREKYGRELLTDTFLVMETLDPMGFFLARDISMAVANGVFGLEDLFEIFHKMRCLYSIGRAMESYSSEIISGGGWYEELDYAAYYQTYIKLCMLGDTYLYGMMTRESILATERTERITEENKEKNEEEIDPDSITGWYERSIELYKNEYTNIQDYCVRVYKFYQALMEGSANQSYPEGTDSLHTRTIRGVLTHDRFLSDEAEMTRPDTDRPDSDAGEPAARVSVRLVGKTSGTVYDSTFTDLAGRYTLHYMPEAAAGEPLQLVIAEICRGENFVQQTVDVWQQSGITFRSDYTSELMDQIAGSPTWDSVNLTDSFGYCDQLFLQPSGEYCHDLARLSLGMAVAGYSAPDTDGKWAADGNFGRDRNLQAAFADLGFDMDSYRSCNYDITLNNADDKVAFAFAKKDITNPFISVLDDPEQKEHVIAVVLRGGGYGLEWASNFHVADPSVPGYHAGFCLAAREVADALEEYVKPLRADGRPIRLWMTGFSRSAAAANLLSEIVYDRALFDSMYVYTFATPSGTKSPREIPGLFNIVYDEDLVPNVAVAQWGYGRNGKTLRIADPDSTFTEEELQAVQRKFSAIVQYSGAVYNPRDYIGSSYAFEEMIRALLHAAPTDEEFAERLQPYIPAILQLLMCRPEKSAGTEKVPLAEKNQYLADIIEEEHPTYREIAYSLSAFLGTGNIHSALKLMNEYYLDDPNPSLQKDTQMLKAARTALSEVRSIADRLPADTADTVMDVGEYTEALFHILVSGSLARAEYRQAAAAAKGTDGGEAATDGMSSDETEKENLAVLWQILCTLPEAIPEVARVFRTNTTMGAVRVAHSPETYLSWMQTLSGKKLFDQQDHMSVDVPLLFRNVMHGMVYEAADGTTPVPGATILLHAWDGTETTLTADGNGYWEIPYAPMAFDIEVYADGYETYTIENVMHTGREGTLDAYLRTMDEIRSLSLFTELVESRSDSGFRGSLWKAWVEAPAYGSTIDGINRMIHGVYNTYTPEYYLKARSGGGKTYSNSWRMDTYGSALMVEMRESYSIPGRPQNNYTHALFLDPWTGESMTFERLIPPENQEIFIQLLAEQLRPFYDNSYSSFYQSPEDTAAAFTAGRVGAWTLNGNKLWVIFDRGTIAEQISGDFRFSFDLDVDLVDIINPIYRNFGSMAGGNVVPQPSGDESVAQRLEQGYEIQGQKDSSGNASIAVCVDGAVKDMGITVGEQNVTAEKDGQTVIVQIGSTVARVQAPYCRDTVIFLAPENDRNVNVSWRSGIMNYTLEFDWENGAVVNLKRTASYADGKTRNMKALAQTAEQLLKENRLSKARDAYEILASRYPENAQYQLTLADIFRQTDNWTGAIMYAGAAVEADPSAEEAWLIMLQGTTRLFLADDALDVLDHAPSGMETYSEWNDSKLFLSAWLTAIHRPEDARRVLDSMAGVVLTEYQQSNVAYYSMLADEMMAAGKEETP